MQFIPHTEETEREILRAIGVSSFEELIANIPEELRKGAEFQLPEPLDEPGIISLMKERAGANSLYLNFLGAGRYDHFIPAVVDFIIGRSEFYTAYTPYQAEVSQGTLQAMYEYQSLICRLTGMEVANASMYDGASALAEAVMMAAQITRKDQVLVAETIHPFYLRVLESYLEGRGITLHLIPQTEGCIKPESLAEFYSDEHAAVVIQHPNFYGILEDVIAIEEVVRKGRALYVVSVDPISLGLLKPPGEYGADIVVGEGQSLGNHQYFGGPGLGIFATRARFVRKMPGRIAGRTVDRDGKPGYVLTLQTREQHIRRERATSNICTNQQLNALAATVYLSLMGKKGLKAVAEICLHKSRLLAEEIEKLKGYELAYRQPFFKEFVVRTPVKAAEIVNAGIEKKIFPGVDLGQFDDRLAHLMLIAVTEKRTQEEMKQLVNFLEEFCD